MKNKTAILYYIAAVGFYIAAAFKFLAHDDSGMGIVWLCMGSSMLCTVSFWLNKMKKSDKSEKEE